MEVKLAINELEEKERVRVGNELLTFLSPYFLRPFYLSQEQLEKEWAEFLRQPFFWELVQEYEEEQGVKVGFVLKEGRLKLCDECGQPYLATDKGAKSKVCHWETYRSFTEEGKELNTAQRSVCWVKRNRRHSTNYLKKKESEETCQ